MAIGIAYKAFLLFKVGALYISLGEEVCIDLCLCARYDIHICDSGAYDAATLMVGTTCPKHVFCSLGTQTRILRYS